jgi:hypothetical protein
MNCICTRTYGQPHQIFYVPAVEADDVTLLGDNIDTIKKSTETLIDGSKEVGLEIGAEKTKYYMLLSRH